jgi:hypothetical protein
MRWKSVVNRTVIALALMLALGRGTAHSAVIIPGQTAVPNAESETGAIVGHMVSRFQIGQGIGYLESYVYLERSGTLDFVYELENYTISSPFVSVTTSPFVNNPGLDVGYEPRTGFLTAGVGADLPVSSATRSADGNVLTLNFLGSNAVQTGESADLVIVRTDGIGYFMYFTIGGTVTDAAGDQAVGVTFFGPDPLPVPEPPTAAMAVIAVVSLLTVAALRRRQVNAETVPDTNGTRIV